MTFIPKNVCSREIHLDVEGGVVQNLEFVGGCNGNLKGISKLVCGRNAVEVIELLKDVKCGNKPTSCPAQLAEALREATA